MAISYVGQASGISSATLPTHQAGDLILAFAYRDGSTTAPTVPGGWTTISSGTGGGGSSNSSALAYLVASAPGTSSGTWTNATGVIFHIYRGVSVGAPIGTNATSTGSTATVTYPALTGLTAGSWVVGFVGHRSIDTNVQIAPTGMTNRSNYVDAVNEVAGHDTNTDVTSWSSTNVSVGGTASNWITRVVEIEATQDYDLTETYTGTSSVGATLTFQVLVYSSLSSSGTLSEGSELFLGNGVRVTESGDRRVTESGTDQRVTEVYTTTGTTYSETLTVSGSGSLASIASLTLNASSTLIGSLAQLSASTLSMATQALLTAAGTLSGTSSLIKNAASSLNANGTLLGTASLLKDAASSLAGAGTIQSSGAIIRPASSSLSGSLTALAIASRTVSAQSSVSGTGTIQSVPTVTLSASTGLTSSGSVTGSGAVTRQASSSLSATGVFEVRPMLMFAVASLYQSSGALVATADMIRLVQAQATQPGAGSLYGFATMIHNAESNNSDNRRITEASDVRITEEGDFRTMFNDGNRGSATLTATATIFPFVRGIYAKKNGTWGLVTPRVFRSGHWVRPNVYVKQNGIWKRVN